MTSDNDRYPRLHEQIAERRKDLAFRDRLQERLREDAVILDRLANGDDDDA